MSNNKELTKVEEKVLDFMILYANEHNIIPSREDISKSLNLKDLSYIGTLLNRLIKKGYIKVLNGKHIRNNDVEIITKDSIHINIKKENYFNNSEKDIIKLIDEFVEKNNYIPPNKYIEENLNNLTIKHIKNTLSELKRRGALKKYNRLPSLTDSQYSMLKHIENFSAANGYPPTIRELCSLSGYTSTSTVHGIIQRIIDKGILKKETALPRTLTEVNEDINYVYANEDDLGYYLNAVLTDICTDSYSVTLCTINEIRKIKNSGILLHRENIIKMIENATEIDKNLNMIKNK